MFKKILLPLDGSRNAEQALFWAKKYAAPSKAQVVLLRILPPEYPLEGLPFRAGAGEARNYLQGIERELNFSGIPTRIILRNEPVSRSIAESARREGCDLILMTSRGASKIVRWLIGGVTQQVMRLSPVPVFIVRSSIAEQVHQQPRRILVPQDGSPLSRKILPLVRRLARFHKARLDLLHVRTAETSALSANRALSRESARLRNEGLRVALRFENGDPADEILKACTPGDLLAMSTHGYGGFKRLLLGSIAEKVIQQAPVPVFIYKKAAKSPRLARDLASLEIFDR